jgi:hypothetical protein
MKMVFFKKAKQMIFAGLACAECAGKIDGGHFTAKCWVLSGLSKVSGTCLACHKPQPGLRYLVLEPEEE